MGRGPRGCRRPPVGPLAVTVVSIRPTRNTRAAPRSRSKPVRYQRPCHWASPHGWRCRVLLSVVGLAVPEGHLAPVADRPAAAARTPPRWSGPPARSPTSEASSMVTPAARSLRSPDAAGPARLARVHVAGGQGQGRHLVRLERDLRQRILALVDAVAELVVEDRVDDRGHERDPRARAARPCRARTSGRTPRRRRCRGTAAPRPGSGPSTAASASRAGR